jgi:hypothetical protein
MEKKSWQLKELQVLSKVKYSLLLENKIENLQMPWKEIDEITLDNRLTERQKETNIVTTM